MFGLGNKLEFVTIEEFDKLVLDSRENYLVNKDRIEMKDAVLLLMSSIDHSKSVVSRTLMQKEVFLLYEKVLKDLSLSNGAAEDAGYFAYKYGPYSIDLNVSLSTLIFSGQVSVNNYYTLSEAETQDTRNIFQKRFLTYFETNVQFEEIANKYEKLLSKRELNVSKLKSIISSKKRAWDQSGYRGIRALIKDLKLDEKFFSDSKLKDVRPEFFFGRITEDYIPRQKGGILR